DRHPLDPRPQARPPPLPLLRGEAEAGAGHVLVGDRHDLLPLGAAEGGDAVGVPRVQEIGPREVEGGAAVAEPLNDPEVGDPPLPPSTGLIDCSAVAIVVTNCPVTRRRRASTTLSLPVGTFMPSPTETLPSGWDSGFQRSFLATRVTSPKSRVEVMERSTTWR